MDERIKERLKKVYALSQRGVDGERVMAEQMLQKLCKQYGITAEDLNHVETDWFTYRIGSKIEIRLFIQCMANFFGSKSQEYKTLRSKTCRSVKFQTTTADNKLFAEFWKRHKTQYAKFVKLQKSMFLKSYCHSHMLFDSSPEDKDASEPKPLTEDEYRVLQSQKKVADYTTEHISKLKQIGE